MIYLVYNSTGHSFYGVTEVFEDESYVVHSDRIIILRGTDKVNSIPGQFVDEFRSQREASILAHRLNTIENVMDS